MGDERDRIEKIVDLSAPVSTVWRAITDHVQFGEWFRVRLDGPFEVGGTTTGRITYPGHEDVKWVSLTEEMTPERRFVFSWPPGAVDPDTEYAYSNGNSFVGGEPFTNFGANQDATWQGRFNINFGYYF